MRSHYTMPREKFQRIIRAWYRQNGRHALPWRKFERSLPAGRQAYHILVSEVMLQQTQVSRVIPKYSEFLQMFPTIQHLARAPLNRVLAAWQGLGYNRRAIALNRAAKIILQDFDGKIPTDRTALESLPGIGPGTAGAVLAFAFGKRVPFIETNIRRVYIHFFFPRERAISDQSILTRIEAGLPSADIRDWYYALMDYGAIALKAVQNPNQRSAHYVRQTPFKGSNREMRGWIIKELAEKRHLTHIELTKRILNLGGPSPKTFITTLNQLKGEGFLSIKNHTISLAH